MRLKVSADQRGINRAEILASYRLLRAATVRVTSAASSACNKADYLRAAELLRLTADGGRIVAAKEDIEMLADVALFEPDGDGKRAYDRFLKGRTRKLAPADREVALKLATAFFSFFRVAGRHETAGLWLEDLLADNRPIWIVDEGLEASAPEGLCLAARLFDAGDYHAGFGIVIPLSDQMVDAYIALSAMPGMAPTAGFLVPYIYANAIHGAVG